MADISIHLLTPEDLAIADSIITSAFGFTGSRLDEIRRYFALKPNRWFLASCRGEPAGVVGATNYGPFAYLGMMTVRRELQRRGIGRALLERMLDWSETQKIPCLRLDATDTGFVLYRQFGFEVIDRALMFEIADYTPASNFPSRVRPLTLEDIQALVDFDTPVFGAGRQCLFQVMLRDFPDRAFAVFNSSGNLTGYLFAQSRRLGPWAAGSPADAEALLQAALTLAYDDSPLAITPETNTSALDLLGRYGFRLSLTNRHMQRGLSTSPGRRTAIYGQTSFAVG